MVSFRPLYFLGRLWLWNFEVLEPTPAKLGRLWLQTQTFLLRILLEVLYHSEASAGRSRLYKSRLAFIRLISAPYDLKSATIAQPWNKCLIVIHSNLFVEGFRICLNNLIRNCNVLVVLLPIFYSLSIQGRSLFNLISPWAHLCVLKDFGWYEDIVKGDCCLISLTSTNPFQKEKWPSVQRRPVSSGSTAPGIVASWSVGPVWNLIYLRLRLKIRLRF